MMRGVLQQLVGRGKYGKRMGNRGLLSAKRGNKNFYRGTGGRRVGVHTDKGGYVIRPRMMMDIQQPLAGDPKLKAYVVPTAKKI